MQVTRIHEGDVFSVERLRFDDPQGRNIVKDVVRHPGAVTVIPVDSDGHLVMIRNYRVTVQQWLLEFCAGKIDAGEAPLESATRELQEETGFKAGRIRPIGRFYTSPGFADEMMHVFLATELQSVPRSLQPGERIEVVHVSPEQLDRDIADGTLVDGKSIASWMICRQYMDPS